MRAFIDNEYMDIADETEEDIDIHCTPSLPSRVSAIETAIADLAIQQMNLEVVENA